MNGRLAALALALFALMPSSAAAQAAQPAPQTPPDPAVYSRPWIAAGALSTSSLGDCTDCEITTYRHTGSILANAGWSINPRTDLGAELMWVASRSTGEDRVRVTFLLASAQFRPWRTRGFFLKTGAGMAFVHNWILDPNGEGEAFRSKAFALALGTGWEWRLSRHLGAQVIAAHHVAALGDMQTSAQIVENVVGNFWSIGATVVIR